MDNVKIRPIEKKDNEQIADLIRSVLIEHNVPKVGTAYADPQLDYMFENYSVERSVYFIVEKDGKIIGGAGIGQLENAEDSICELQKMYFLSEARGLGLGKQIIDKCLAQALEFDYQYCYLETMPYMEAAQKLYMKSGFKYIDAPMGNTGHTSCPVWMLKQLF